jgi:hypothetical protein
MHFLLSVKTLNIGTYYYAINRNNFGRSMYGRFNVELTNGKRLTKMQPKNFEQTFLGGGVNPSPLPPSLWACAQAATASMQGAIQKRENDTMDGSQKLYIGAA